MRLLLSLLLSAVTGAIAVVVIALWRGTSLGSPDFVGFMVVTVAVALFAGVMLYAPMVFLLRRRDRARPLPAALFVGLLANLPILLILLILEQRGGVFAAGEAWLIAGQALLVGVTHGVSATWRGPAARMTQPAEPTYSQLWFRTFLEHASAEQTAREVSFLARQLPLPAFRRVLDLCCGPARHALPLAALGYDVTGLDRDAAAIERARAAAASATFVQGDVRNVAELAGMWDAVTIMWASFGYFTAAQNMALLHDVHGKLRPGGRLVLDVYHRDWFARHQGEYRRQHGGVDIVEDKQLEGDRLTVVLRYDGSDVVDRFSWQVFTPAELLDVLARAGFAPVTVCADFDEAVPATAEHARMQLVVESVAAA